MVHRIHELHQLHPMQKKSVTKQSKSESISFQKVLSQTQSLKWSKHAQKRLDERNIELTAQQLLTMNEKVKEAKRKGVTDSLVIFNHAAFVVNAKNDTIVTALDLEEANSKIFTNINGTILINQ